MARWIPTEVVVHNRVEQRLQINALGKAVSRNQDPAFRTFELVDTDATLFGCQTTRDDGDVGLGEALRKLVAKRLSRCDELAENNRLGPVLKQGLQNLQQSDNLGIRRTTCIERLRHRDQLSKLGAFFRVGSCSSRFEIPLIEKAFVLIKDDRLHCLFVGDPA